MAVMACPPMVGAAIADAVFTDDSTPNIVGKGKTKQALGFRLVNGGSNEPTVTVVNAETALI
jgi:hypothetical protein